MNSRRQTRGKMRARAPLGALEPLDMMRSRDTSLDMRNVTVRGATEYYYDGLANLSVRRSTSQTRIVSRPLTVSTRLFLIPVYLDIPLSRRSLFLFLSPSRHVCLSRSLSMFSLNAGAGRVGS